MTKTKVYINNIHRGRNGMIWGQLREVETDNLAISATMEYIVEVLQSKDRGPQYDLQPVEVRP